MPAPTAPPKEKTEAAAPGLTREQLLEAALTAREEKLVRVPGLGPVLVGEISGDERATIVEAQIDAIQNERANVRGYQKKILAYGILDPVSPEGARVPLFREADVDALMKLGAAKIRLLVEEIERLSGMGPAALASAEGNSDGTRNGSSTSG